MLTAPKVRKLFAAAIESLALNPKDIGFHCLCCSVVCLALELKTPLENIKLHGHWKSNAEWKYLATIFFSKSIK